MQVDERTLLREERDDCFYLSVGEQVTDEYSSSSSSNSEDEILDPSWVVDENELQARLEWNDKQKQKEMKQKRKIMKERLKIARDKRNLVMQILQEREKRRVHEWLEKKREALKYNDDSEEEEEEEPRKVWSQGMKRVKLDAVVIAGLQRIVADEKEWEQEEQELNDKKRDSLAIRGRSDSSPDNLMTSILEEYYGVGAGLKIKSGNQLRYLEEKLRSNAVDIKLNGQTVHPSSNSNNIHKIKIKATKNEPEKVIDVGEPMRKSLDRNKEIEESEAKAQKEEEKKQKGKEKEKEKQDEGKGSGKFHLHTAKLVKRLSGRKLKQEEHKIEPGQFPLTTRINSNDKLKNEHAKDKEREKELHVNSKTKKAGEEKSIKRNYSHKMKSLSERNMKLRHMQSQSNAEWKFHIDISSLSARESRDDQRESKEDSKKKGASQLNKETKMSLFSPKTPRKVIENLKQLMGKKAKEEEEPEYLSSDDESEEVLSYSGGDSDTDSSEGADIKKRKRLRKKRIEKKKGESVRSRSLSPPRRSRNLVLEENHSVSMRSIRPRSSSVKTSASKAAERNEVKRKPPSPRVKPLDLRFAQQTPLSSSSGSVPLRSPCTDGSDSDSLEVRGRPKMRRAAGETWGSLIAKFSPRLRNQEVSKRASSVVTPSSSSASTASHSHGKHRSVPSLCSTEDLGARWDSMARTRHSGSGSSMPSGGSVPPVVLTSQRSRSLSPKRARRHSRSSSVSITHEKDTVRRGVGKDPKFD